MAEDVLNYPARIQEALREMVRQVLREVGESGLPGEHHFYITFRTDHAGVELPDDLLDLYPEEMTIVLRHQFWELAVDDDGFGVTLAFKGVKKHMYVPFRAIRSFVDPKAELALQLDPALAASGPGPAAAGAPNGDAEPEPPPRDDNNVVSIDRFRKK